MELKSLKEVDKHIFEVKGHVVVHTPEEEKVLKEMLLKF